MGVIDVEGLRIAYERAGTGPALVLLQGFVGDGATTWRRQLEALSDEFTVVAWDAPGAGGSSDPPESFGMAGYADCLAAFVAGLGLERPFVAGLSFGGALAIEFCRRHPAVARALVLASAHAGWGGSLPAQVADERLRLALALASRTPDELRRPPCCVGTGSCSPGDRADRRLTRPFGRWSCGWRGRIRGWGHRRIQGELAVLGCTGAAVCFVVWVPKLNGHEDNIDEATDAISDARGDASRGDRLLLLRLRRLVSDGLAPVVARLAGT